MQRPHVEYLVEPIGRRWSIYLGDVPLGQFPDKEAAVRTAVDSAEGLRAQGYDVRVGLRETDGAAKVLVDR